MQDLIKDHVLHYFFEKKGGFIRGHSESSLLVIGTVSTVCGSPGGEREVKGHLQITHKHVL